MSSSLSLWGWCERGEQGCVRHRITLRYGSVRQKRWSLNHPVTVVGKLRGTDRAQRRSTEGNQNMDIKRSGSQPSGKGPSEWFTGTVRIDPLFQANAPARA